MPDEVDRISFRVPADLVPPRTLEQSVYIRALLATILSVQCDIYAALTEQDNAKVIEDRVEMLENFVLKYAREVDTSTIESTFPKTPSADSE